MARRACGSPCVGVLRSRRVFGVIFESLVRSEGFDCRSHLRCFTMVLELVAVLLIRRRQRRASREPHPPCSGPTGSAADGAQSRLIETHGGRAVLVVAFEGCDGLAREPSADRPVWLVNEVSARRFPSVAWLQRGVSAVS